MKLIKKIFLLLFLCLLSVVLIISYNGYNMYKSAIEKMPINDKINEIKQNKNYVKINEMPDYLINAVIAVEDHRFYIHKGIDVIATTKAMFANIKNKDIVAGGSSITQQLAKNMYFSQEKQFKRKIAEIFVVSQLEENLTKEEILELYLNTIYYGNGYYGIGNASKGYFNKKVKDLTLEEATILAGLPNAPSAYSLNKNKDLAIKRQKQVIEAMIKYNYLDEDYKSTIKED